MNDNKYTKYALRLFFLGGFSLSTIILIYLLNRADRMSPLLFYRLVYFTPPGLLAVLSIIALFASAYYQTRLFIMMTSLGLSLLFAEVFLEYSSTNSRPLDVRLEHPLGYDMRTKREVISDLRQEGIDAYPAVPGSYWYRHHPEGLQVNGGRIYPITGISDVVTVQGNENGDYLIFHSDDFGFNNPSGLYTEKSLDIAIVGDSFVRGEQVPRTNNAVNIVRHVFPSTLGFGANAIGPYSMLGLIREYISMLEPSYVFWCYFEGNDLLDVQDEAQTLLTNYLDPAFRQDLMAHQDTIDAELKNMINNHMQAKLATMPEDEKNHVKKLVKTPSWRRIVKLHNIRNMLGLAQGRNIFQALEDYETILKVAKAETTSWNGTLVFVYLPEWSSFSTRGRRGPYRRYRNRILNLAYKLDIPIVDVETAFRQHNDPLSLFPFRKPGHYNPEGYRVMGEAITKYINEQDNPPSPSRL